ncbi:MAG: BrnT family toxin [bacterium]|nr:BrnT family toxin [bacterium]
MDKEKRYGLFVWNTEKERDNIQKHKLDFYTASKAFSDSKRIIAIDEKHSEKEERYFCIGKVDSHIITVRFTYRNKLIRIIGAGYWRKGRILYEKK